DAQAGTVENGFHDGWGSPERQGCPDRPELRNEGGGSRSRRCGRTRRRGLRRYEAGPGHHPRGVRALDALGRGSERRGDPRGRKRHSPAESVDRQFVVARFRVLNKTKATKHQPATVTAEEEYPMKCELNPCYRVRGVSLFLLL